MFTSILPLLFIATVTIQVEPETPDFSGRFALIIEKSAIELQKAAHRRAFRLKNWNDSIEKTAFAARGMASKADPQQVWEALENARLNYSGNNFAILLQAIIKSSQGDVTNANFYFEQFLLNSQTFTEFEEAFIRWGEFHMLRRTVYEILRSRGISFEGREEEIRVRVPYEAFFKYVMNPGREDWLMNISFVVMIVFGGVLLLIAALSGVDFSTSLPGSFVVMYLIIWIAYGMWVFDLAFGLPFGWSRYPAVPIFLILTSGPLIVIEGVMYWKDKNLPLEDGYRRCPYCREVIIQLVVECPSCRKKL